MEQTRIQIALLHHTGCGNLRYDAILDVVVSNIRRRWNNAEIKGFSMNPDDTAERHGIPSYPIRRYRWNIGRRPATRESTQPGGNKLRNWFRKTRNPAVRLPRAAFGELAFLVESYRILRSFDLL